MIVWNYTRVYKENKFTNTKILIGAFGVLALSQLAFLIPHIDAFFIIGSFLELGGYVILLGLMVRILKHGEKERPHGDNIGHVGDHSRKRRKY